MHNELVFRIVTGAEDGGANADEGGSLGEGQGVVVAHAHGELAEVGRGGEGAGLEAVEEEPDGMEISTDACLVGRIGGHGHKAADACMLQILSELHVFQLAGKETEFGLLLCHMDLQQHIDGAANLGSGGIHVAQMLQGVDSVDHADEGDVVLELLGLEVADEVPLDVGRQEGGLVAQLGGVVLAEEALSSTVGLEDVLHGLEFRDGDEASRRRQGGLDAGYVFSNHTSD